MDGFVSLACFSVYTEMFALYFFLIKFYFISHFFFFFAIFLANFTQLPMFFMCQLPLVLGVVAIFSVSSYFLLSLSFFLSAFSIIEKFITFNMIFILMFTHSGTAPTPLQWYIMLYISFFQCFLFFFLASYFMKHVRYLFIPIAIYVDVCIGVCISLAVA